jgi:hypothetical protein
MLIYWRVYIYICIRSLLRQPARISRLQWMCFYSDQVCRLIWMATVGQGTSRGEKQEAVWASHLGCKSLHHGGSASQVMRFQGLEVAPVMMDAFSVLILVSLQLDTCVLFCPHLCLLVTNFSYLVVQSAEIWLKTKFVLVDEIPLMLVESWFKMF